MNVVIPFQILLSVSCDDACLVSWYRNPVDVHSIAKTEMHVVDQGPSGSRKESSSWSTQLEALTKGRVAYHGMPVHKETERKASINFPHLSS